MTKKQKMEIVKLYYGSIFKNKKDVENYVKKQKDEMVYEYMNDFLKAQAVSMFCED